MRGVDRQQYLEGLRGLACLQVVLLHGFGAFLPALVGPEVPALLRLLYDGDFAVLLFFVLSGHVLTPAFLRGIDRPGALLLGRVVRFLLPASLSCVVGWLIIDPAMLADAGALLGSDWLTQNQPVQRSLAALARDAGLNVLVLGYQGLSVLDRIAPGLLWPDGAAFNPPLWTLSVELQGSALVLLLCRLRGLTAWVWPAGTVLLLVLTARTPFLGFIAGHVLAVHRPGLRLLSATLAAMAGVLVVDPGLVDALPGRELAAIGVFTALLASPRLQRWLGGPLLGRLGALSFPIYLLHWPMLFGPGAAAAVALAPLGTGVAVAGGLACGLVLTALCAGQLRRIDLLALAWSRRVQRRVALPA